MQSFYPKCIVCLTQKTTKCLFMLGEDSRIVGTGLDFFTYQPDVQQGTQSFLLGSTSFIGWNYCVLTQGVL